MADCIRAPTLFRMSQRTQETQNMMIRRECKCCGGDCYAGKNPCTYCLGKGYVYADANPQPATNGAQRPALLLPRKSA